VTTFIDENSDGQAEPDKFYTNTHMPALGLAIGWEGRTVYVAGGGEVLKVEDLDLSGNPDSSVVIIQDLPSFVYDGQSNNGIMIGPDGNLYLTLWWGQRPWAGRVSPGRIGPGG